MGGDGGGGGVVHVGVVKRLVGRSPGWVATVGSVIAVATPVAQ